MFAIPGGGEFLALAQRNLDGAWMIRTDEMSLKLWFLGTGFCILTLLAGLSGDGVCRKASAYATSPCDPPIWRRWPVESVIGSATLGDGAGR